ncbi:hypothetical protein T265_02898 [Opisthorchis viverrini]|uniref:Uncharacterized protein n=1 Tax=Opisthorchis viverrini TaxID=6198 RepID=A0A074ZXS4_OPIVI|nr:hypothetical protein T265_02898 [Opisthorchis viverrini]KER30752.1 hypothetical protein T265_02898 [Opisthorchis viverrini]
MPPEGSFRAGILADFRSLDNSSRDVGIGFEAWTFRSVRGSNPTSSSRLPLSGLGQPGSTPALVQPSGGMAVRHRKDAIAERFLPTLGASSASVVVDRRMECDGSEIIIRPSG